MRIVFLGDIVGNKALRAVGNWISNLQEQDQADFFIVNAENAAEGSGLTKAQANFLLDSGVDCITLGNHSWGHYALTKFVDEETRIIRPANAPLAWPGNGAVVLQKGEKKLRVMSLLGSVFMKGYLSAFAFMDQYLQALEEDKEEFVPIFLDFHAEATAEKQAMARRYDGFLSAVVGTHTHVQTADERILPGGTAFLTDAGMCGPLDSVIGMDVQSSLRRFADDLPSAYKCAEGPIGIRGVCIELDKQGRATYIERIQLNETVTDEWRENVPFTHLR